MVRIPDGSQVASYVNADFQVMPAPSAFPLSPAAANPVIAPLQSVLGSLVAPAGQPSAAEIFRNFGVVTVTQDVAGTVTFKGEEAGYKNSLLLYRLDAQGRVTGAEVLFANASAAGSGGTLQPGLSSVPVNLQAGERVAFALLPNGFANPASRALLQDPSGRFTLLNAQGQPANILADDPAGIRLVHLGPNGQATPIMGQYGAQVFHSAARMNGNQPNPDGFDHADQTVDVANGLLHVGMEDLLGLGDNDRDDLRITLDLGRANAAALMGQTVPPALDILGLFDTDGDGALSERERQPLFKLMRMMDADGNATLSPAERQRLTNLLKLLDGDADGRLGPGERRALTMLLDLADANRDGRLSEAERATLGEVLTALDGDGDGLLERRERALMRELLDLVDANGDGRLSQAERETFALLRDLADANGDGRLSGQERQILQKLRDLFDAGGACGLDQQEAELLAMVLKLADRNGDGALNGFERRRLADLLGLDGAGWRSLLGDPGLGASPMLANLIGLGDLDGDGLLSASDLIGLHDALAGAEDLPPLLDGPLAGLGALTDFLRMQGSLAAPAPLGGFPYAAPSPWEMPLFGPMLGTGFGPGLSPTDWALFANLLGMPVSSRQGLVGPDGRVDVQGLVQTIMRADTNRDGILSTTEGERLARLFGQRS